MKKNIKAISIEKTYHYEKVCGPDPWDEIPAHDKTERRYILVDADTGEVIDDAQGFGYKTPQKAYASYAYKHPTKKQASARTLKKMYEGWARKHRDIADELETEILDARLHGLEVTPEAVKEFARDRGFNLPVSAETVLKIIR